MVGHSVKHIRTLNAKESQLKQLHQTNWNQCQTDSAVIKASLSMSPDKIAVKGTVTLKH